MKILIVGQGSIGQRHLRNIEKFFPNFEIILLRKKYYTPKLNKNNKVIGNKKKDNKYSTFSNYKKALDQNPNAVFICNPTSLHIDYAIEAAKRSINIFVEKPLSHNKNKIKILKNLISKNKIIFMIGFQFRFHPLIKYIKKLLLNNKLGKLIGANIYSGEYLPNFHKYEDYRKSYAANKRLGGGVVLSVIHEIDLCVYFFGKPTSVFSVGGKSSNLDIDVEDYSNSIVCFNNKENNRLPISITLDYLL